MKKKAGDIMYNGLLADVFEDVFCPDTPAPSGHWLNEKVYIYDCLSGSTEKEKNAMMEYLYEEGFIQDRRTKCTVIRGEDMY